MLKKQVQLNMRFLGYYNGLIDGCFGNQFKIGLKYFQNDYGLVKDGVYGINSEKAQIKAVKEIQSIINVNVDGYVGNNTICALKNFQRANNLVSDGIAGHLTRKVLFNSDLPNPITYDTPVDWSTIKYFKKEEFKCPRCCNGYPNTMKQKCLNVADRAREYFNKPCSVTSGLRCQTFNDTLKNSIKNSYHIQGKAMDIFIPGVSGKVLLKYLKGQPEVAYAYIMDINYVHFNTF